MTCRFVFTGLLFRNSAPITTLYLILVVLLLLLTPGPLEEHQGWMFGILVSHCMALAEIFTQKQGRFTEFLYTQGYSRDQIWYRFMLHNLLGALIVWLAAALCLWLPLRSIVQERLFASPYYPILTIREMIFPWYWLCGYVVFLPMFNYVWIRRTQPFKGNEGALLMAVGLVFGAATLSSFQCEPVWPKTTLCILCGVLTVTALIAGRNLHRNLEIY